MTFPLGLPSSAPDPGLQELADEILGRTKPVPPDPIADSHHEIIEVWAGDPLSTIKGGPVDLAAREAFHLFWIQALGCDSPPIFEAAIDAKGWTPPAATPRFSVTPKGPGAWTAGPPPNSGGWQVWTAAEELSRHFANLPEGATLDFATAPQPTGDDPDGTIGRACFSGTIRKGRWEISSASPAVSSDVLVDALGFVRDLIERGRIHVRGEEEREALDEAVSSYSPEEDSLVDDGDFVSLAEDDSRTLRMLASPVCRVRFGEVWSMDPVDED